MKSQPYPVEIAGSGSSTAYPQAAASHGFHRHDQAFQEPNGPPWIHSRNGAGDSAEAPSGSTNQARSGEPSSAVAVTSVREPGTAGCSAGPRRAPKTLFPILL